jgi:hypothetical protein
VVAEGAESAALLGTASASTKPLSKNDVVITSDAVAFGGEKYSLAILSQPKSNYSEAELIARFMKSCTDTVVVTAPGMFDEKVVLPQCEVRPFEQNCSPDGCFDEEEGCLRGCGITCNDCDADCGSTCGTCMNRCTDDVCRRQCAKARVGCFTGCLNGANTCRSNGCANVYATCSTAKTLRIESECGGREACRAAAMCDVEGGKPCPTQSGWCNEACFEQ